MADERPIPSPGTAAAHALISGGISSVSGIGSLWAALDVQITGSGLAFGLEVGAGAAEIGGLAAFGIVGGGLALAAAPVLLTLGGIALLSRSESTLRDVAAGASAVTEFTSPSTLALVALSAPFAGSLPWSGFSDPFAGQALVGGLMDFGLGISSGGGAERLFATTGFLAQAPDAVTQAQQLRQYLSQASGNSANQGPPSGLSPSPGPAPAPPGSGQTGQSSPSYYQSVPGMGDIDGLLLQEALFPQSDYSSSPSNGYSLSITAFGGQSPDYGGSSTSPSTIDASSNANGGAADCDTDCNQDCNSDCTHDCQQDCQHDCQCQCQCECECDECECLSLP